MHGTVAHFLVERSRYAAVQRVRISRRRLALLGIVLLVPEPVCCAVDPGGGLGGQVLGAVGRIWSILRTSVQRPSLVMSYHCKVRRVVKE